MAVDVLPATEADAPVLRQLLELNAQHFAALDGREPGPDGRYGYPYLDLYWAEPDRRPYLVTVGGRVAGCALVRLGDPHQVAEFFVARSHRRTGVGTAAARAVLRRHPGAWSVHQVPGNEGAVAFWRRAVPAGYAETVDVRGTTQTFVVPG